MTKSDSGSRLRVSGRSDDRIAALFIAPGLFMILVFSYYPVVRSLIGAFTSWDGFNTPVFNGLANFWGLAHDTVFLHALWHVGLWVIIAVPLAIIPSFCVAELVFNLKNQGAQRAYRVAFVLPMVLPAVVPILIWEFGIYDPGGILDRILGVSTTWLLSTHTALWAMILMGFPWVSPFNFLIFLAGLQNVDPSLFDAAQIDGAALWQRVVHVDVRLVMGQVKLLIVLAVLGSAQNLLVPLLLTGGGPLNATMTPVLDMYQSAFVGDQYGYAMAISLVMFVFIMVLTLANMRFFNPPGTEG